MVKNYIAAIIAGILVMAAHFSFSVGADRSSKKEAAATGKQTLVNYREDGNRALRDSRTPGKTYAGRDHYNHDYSMARK